MVISKGEKTFVRFRCFHPLVINCNFLAVRKKTEVASKNKKVVSLRCFLKSVIKCIFLVSKKNLESDRNSFMSGASRHFANQT